MKSIQYNPKMPTLADGGRGHRNPRRMPKPTGTWLTNPFPEGHQHVAARSQNHPSRHRRHEAHAQGQQAAKAARRADPAATAAALAALNAPVIQRCRLAAIQKLSSANLESGMEPQAAMDAAFKELQQVEYAAAYRAHVSRARAGRKFPADGTAAHAASRYQAAMLVEVAA
jgi:hypothetical protein